jgi:hypothetical protein
MLIFLFSSKYHFWAPKKSNFVNLKKYFAAPSALLRPGGHTTPPLPLRMFLATFNASQHKFREVNMY